MRTFALTTAIVTSLVLSATPTFAWMPGDSAVDLGCNLYQGGNCGKQLDMQNATWRRLHYPLEQGRGQYGTYLPGGGYVPNHGPGYGYYTVNPMIRQIRVPQVLRVMMQPQRRYIISQPHANVPVQVPVHTQTRLVPVTDSQMAELRSMYK